MKIALFGNYIFAKCVAEILDSRYSLMCFCNNIQDDNKYGKGIQQYASENNIKYKVGTREQHIKAMEEFEPDYILAIAYKNIIPVKDRLIYGIHLGGICGHSAIRGKNSLSWYKLRGIENAKVSLYRYTMNNIDVGNVVSQIEFPISSDDNININSEIECIKFLTKFIVDKNFRLSDFENEFSDKVIGSYYPKVIEEVNGCCLEEKDSEKLLNAKINIKNGIFTEQKIVFNKNEEQVYQYCSGEEDIKNILFLHGFASSIPNDKTKKLSCLLEGIKINVPLVKGINREYCNGLQDYCEVFEQMEMLIDNYNLRETIIVCSSVSSLLLCEHLKNLYDVKGIIFVTPIFNLAENAFDDMLKKVVENGLNEEQFEFTKPYYKGCKMSKQFVEKLKSIDLLTNIEKNDCIKSKLYFIFAKEDSNIEEQKWRKKCIDADIPLNNVNTIDGNHSFGDIQQLFYLACLITAIFENFLEIGSIIIVK